MTLNIRDDIEDFLAQKRLALVGVSRNSEDFSRVLFRDLQRHGYDMVPVNPHGADIEGRHCYARLQDVSPPVDGALVLTPAGQSEEVVKDCAAAGINRVWLHRGAGIGSVSEPALNFCRQHQISVVAGQCPYMFLPDTAWFHRAHAFFRRLLGHYPVCLAH